MIHTLNKNSIDATPLYETIETYISEIFGEIANKAIYKDPYVFAYISQETRVKNTIAPYLIGFTDTEGSVDVIANAEGTIYISNVGYFKTGLPNEAFKIDKTGDKYKVYKTLSEENFEEIKFDFEPLLCTDIIPLEVTAYPNELVTAFFESEQFPELKKADVCPNQIIEIELAKINSALTLIKAANPSYMSDINNIIQRIILHSNAGHLGLTSQAFYGALFLGYSPVNHALHYVDILVHETAHTMLNALLWNPADYFTTDLYSPRFSSSFRKEKRGIFFVLHSNFVMIRLTEFFYSFYEKISLFPEHFTEVVGRLLYYIDLLDDSIPTIDDETYYTQKGYAFYIEFIKEKHSFYRLKTEHLREQYIAPHPANGQPFFRIMPELKEK